jgi:hypothetical protein
LDAQCVAFNIKLRNNMQNDGFGQRIWNWKLMALVILAVVS